MATAMRNNNTTSKVIFVIAFIISLSLVSADGGWTTPNDGGGSASAQQDSFLNFANCYSDNCLFNTTQYENQDYITFIGNGDLYYTGG